MDRGFQSHHDFDLLQEEDKHFVYRIKAKTARTVLQENAVEAGSHIFYDVVVLLGTPGRNQTASRSDVVGYQIAEVKYYVVTDRHYLTAEQIATVYKLRWTIESFFKWWKKHLKIYHLIARSKYGLLFQMLDGLITYLLMAIYCREQFNGQDEIDKIENQLFKEQYKLSLAKS